MTSSELSIIGSDAVNGSAADEPVSPRKIDDAMLARSISHSVIPSEQAIAITSASIETRRLDEAG